ncbi:alpha/beta hydrolase [Dyella solisilvae]|uniref:Alpha/beta hydrolase n=1 Tax=Dyella solisilvae TaxID=1920168 RepID=A0A370K809_9GAMM|nr:alpha/beta hydrolase [Dyella solisilvae]RDI98791.1 alpha/beta hydrolase [Dyella solisilvae]
MIIRALKRLVILLLVVLATAVGMRAWDAWRGPPLHAWHTFEPRELTAAQLDATDWKGYLAAEQAIFDQVRRNVTEKLPASDQVATNRYYANAPIYPGHFATDWNRSYQMAPTGTPVGAVVLLHGLTDSPYSLRHIARVYHDAGFYVVAIRLPGHGTVPAGLSHVQWQDWAAATRLAVREARTHTDPHAPLHLVGFSNGGSLALKYALDAIEDHRLARPDRLILISPMIGITRFARFAGIAGLPAMLPPFARASWLDVVPEFNPFKYNSFPVNGARQAYRLTDALQGQLQRLARDNELGDIAPILTFQSVVDFTVSTRAVIRSLYGLLPDNGSEIVLFDVNRDHLFDVLMRRSSSTALTRVLPNGPQRFRITVLGSVPPDNEIAEITIAPHTTEQRIRPLSLHYPPGVFSMSHVSLPFPLDDSLYGTTPNPDEFYGTHLGVQTPRGERGTLVLNIDAMMRMASNPFFSYVLDRVREQIASPAPPPSHGETRDQKPPSETEMEAMEREFEEDGDIDAGGAQLPW